MCDHSAPKFQVLYVLQVTTLDTHDGIGIVDVADLMTQEQISRTQDNVYEHGANANKRYSTSCYGNLDTYQVSAASVADGCLPLMASSVCKGKMYHEHVAAGALRPSAKCCNCHHSVAPAADELRILLRARQRR